MKKALLSILLVAPALVACGGRDVVATVDQDDNPIQVDCKNQEVRWPEATKEVLHDWATPKKVSQNLIKELGDNTLGAIGASYGLAAAESAIKKACSGDVKYTSAGSDGLKRIQPKQAIRVAKGDFGTYKSGLTIKVRDASYYDWVKSSNTFADKVAPAEGQDMVIVDLTVGNKGDSPETMHGTNLQLADSKGRRYNHEVYSSDFEMWVQERRNGNLNDFSNVNPGAKANRTLLFFVPSTAEGLRLVDRDVYSYSLN